MCHNKESCLLGRYLNFSVAKLYIRSSIISCSALDSIRILPTIYYYLYSRDITSFPKKEIPQKR